MFHRVRALALLLAATAARPTLGDPGQAPVPAPLAGLEAALRRVVRTHRIPGAAVALFSRRGTEWVGAFGLADPATARPVQPATPFRVGSITKTAVAVAVMRLVEAGELGLADEVRDLVPGLPLGNPWEATDPVRLVHLLEHSAGLDDVHFDEVIDHQGREDRPLDEVLARHPERLRVRWRPGTRFAYCNRGYLLLGRILERVAGRPFDRALAELVLEPVGMAHASLRREPGRGEPPAQGHAAPGVPVPYEPAWFRPAAALLASVEDLARLGRLLLEGGELDGARILDRATVARMERATSTAAARAGIEAGYGLGIGTRLEHGVRALGHYGGGYASTSAFRYLPRVGRGYAVALNVAPADAALAEIKTLLVEALVPDGADPPEPERPLDPALARRLRGSWWASNPWYEPTRPARVLTSDLWVGLRPDGLWLHPFGRPARRLVPVGGARFRLEGQPVASLVLVEEAGSGPVLAGSYAYFEPLAWPWPEWLRALLAVAAMVSLGVTGAVLASGARAEPGAIAAGLATACLVAGLLVAASVGYQELGLVSPRTAAVFVLGLAYAALVALALLRAPGGGALARLGALAHLPLLAYLLATGAIGLRLWAD